MTSHTTPSALLVLGGEHPGRAMITTLRASHSTVVAVDAGALILEELGLHPDVVIGDMDSAGDALERFERKGVVTIVEPGQSHNDLEKGLAWAYREDIRSITLVGVGGGMFDHAINNVSILARWSEQLSITIVDSRSIATPVREVRRFRADVGDRVSLIPLPSARLTTEGLAWDLSDERLELGVREGASNHAVAVDVTVSVHEGCVLAFHYPGQGPLANLGLSGMMPHQ